jgi:hypothetical protein
MPNLHFFGGCCAHGKFHLKSIGFPISSLVNLRRPFPGGGRDGGGGGRLSSPVVVDSFIVALILFSKSIFWLIKFSIFIFI